MNKRKDAALNIAEKLKEAINRICNKTHLNKKLLPVLALFAAGIIILAADGLVSGISDKTEKPSEINAQVSVNDYVSDLEERITSIISSIDGAGATRVMITLESGNEDVYLHNYDYGEDVDSSGAGNREMRDEYVIVNAENGEKGIVVRVEEPEIRGVAVVCEGGGNSYVRAEIISTVTALLNISSARVSVAKMG
ncbi:MAG: hypothetical protein J6J45_01570 [Clostridia bacterium]|nr:hypothetical protein [Clostridia bacterium]